MIQMRLAARVVAVTDGLQAWAQAQSSLFFIGSADDIRDGFIHLSAAHQLTTTANKYFCGQADLVLVAFCAGDLSPHLVWEPSRGGDLFPHYYGALPAVAALSVRPVPLDEHGVPRVPANLDRHAAP